MTREGGSLTSLARQLLHFLWSGCIVPPYSRANYSVLGFYIVPPYSRANTVKLELSIPPYCPPSHVIIAIYIGKKSLLAIIQHRELGPKVLFVAEMSDYFKSLGGDEKARYEDKL